MTRRPDVRLRPVERDDLPMIAGRHADAETTGAYTWYGFRSAETTRRQFEDDGFLDYEHGMLVVVAHDEVAGTVGWNPVHHGPPPTSRCFNLGISLLPAFRGRGIGSAAQRALGDYLFATTTAQRLEAGTDVEHAAEQRALENAGFTREGVLRAGQFRAGAWRDLVLYSRLRTDP